MSEKYKVVILVGAFVPVEKILFKSRFEWLARKIASYHLKRKYAKIPMYLQFPNDDKEWLNAWAAQSIDEQKESLEFVGEVEGRCDVIDIKQDVIRGSSPVETEIPEEQIIKEIEASNPIKQAPLPEDEASRRLEIIRREMQAKKRALTEKKIILP